jgi:glutathione S-transferase
MIELIQCPWSPYCLVQRRILEYSRVKFKITNIPPSDRSLIWKLTRERYYQAPIIVDKGHAVFEVDDNSQVIAKYIDSRLQLGLFPLEWEGVQKILWRYIDNDVEGLTFRLNDAHFREFVPKAEQLAYLRHKERKFGRGCLDDWLKNKAKLTAELEQRLVPFEQMLAHKQFLLGSRPVFVDFDLWGMMANFLFSGRNRLPASLPAVKQWHARMSRIQRSEVAREKLHS